MADSHGMFYNTRHTREEGTTFVAEARGALAVSLVTAALALLTPAVRVRLDHVIADIGEHAAPLPRMENREPRRLMSRVLVEGR